MPSPGSPNRPTPAHDALPPLGFVLLAGLTLFWGLNWPAMKIALAELPVWWFRAGCLWFGGLGLILIARFTGQSLRVPAVERGPLLLCALFNVVGWHVTKRSARLSEIHLDPCTPCRTWTKRSYWFRGVQRR